MRDVLIFANSKFYSVEEIGDNGIWASKSGAEYFIPFEEIEFTEIDGNRMSLVELKNLMFWY